MSGRLQQLSSSVLATRRVRVVALAVISGVVAACSGGSDTPQTVSPPPPPPPSMNNPPTISGSPALQVTEDQPYSFTPAASDSDGDTLTFSVANQPAWASFDLGTGTLSGTPRAAHVGMALGVTISVSDGQAMASLAPFDLEVQQIQLGSATVSWAVPITNADGSMLTDLAGYRIHYGTTSSVYPMAVDVNDPASTGASVSDLQPGIWYFAVTAIDHSSNESAYSTEVSKVVNP